MKFPALAFVTFFVLEDYGTIHAKPIASYEPVQQVALFKRYAEKYIDAAMKPLLADKPTVEGLCKCIPIVEHEQSDHPINVTLSTMSIVKDYYRDFQVIAHNPESNLDAIMPIKAGLMKNIQNILFILAKPVRGNDLTELSDMIRNYLSKIKGTSVYKQRFESAMQCYRTMYTFRSKCFYGQFSQGFGVLSGLLLAHVRGLDDHLIRKQFWSQLDEITGQIAGCELKNVPDPQDTDQEVARFRNSVA